MRSPALMIRSSGGCSRSQAWAVSASASTTKTAWLARTSGSGSPPNARASPSRTRPHSSAGSWQYSDTLLAPVGAGSRYTATPALSGPRSLIWPSIAPRCSPRRSSTAVDLLNSPTIPHIPCSLRARGSAMRRSRTGHGPLSNRASMQRELCRYLTHRASRAVEPDGAGEDVAEPLGLFHPPRERVHDRPAAHPLAVDLECVAELVEAAAHPADRVGLDREIGTAVAQQRGGVEGAVAGERLGVDGEPRGALGAQDVAAVEVLVQDGDLFVRHGREQLADPGDGPVEQRALERAAVALPANRQLGSPAPRLAGERAEVVIRRQRAPQGAKDLRGKAVGLLLVGDAPQRRAGEAPLDEQGAALGVGREQPHRAGAAPEREGVRLVRALGLREVDLQHGLRAVGQRGGRDER